MSPLMILFAFMLPIFTAATLALDEEDPYTLFPSKPMGDVLNVTQCYCQSLDPLSPDATFGYYYLFSYWNYHLSRTYDISVNCTSSAPHNSNGTKPDKCMDNIRKHEEICQTYPDGNKFCYKFNEDVDNVYHDKPSASHYGFNGQKRDVPERASDVLTLWNVTQDCDAYCEEELGELMMTIQTPESLIPGVGKVANSIVSYSDLDDMCFTCA